MTDRDSSDADAERHAIVDAAPQSQPSDAEPSPASARTVTDQGTVMMGADAGAEVKARAKRAKVTAQGTVMMDPDARSRSKRTSRVSTISQLRNSRTTLLEVSQVAERLSVVRATIKPGQQNPLGSMLVAFAISATLVLIGTMVFAGGALRIVLGVLGGMAVSTLAITYTLSALPRLAQRLGNRELPGPAMAWVGLFAVVSASGAIALTFGLSAATKGFAVISVPKPVAVAADDGDKEKNEEPKDDTPRGDADKNVQRGQHVSLGNGVLYVPPTFSAPDGRFDLVIHYHGNVELVEQSIAQAQLNALVHIINYGEMSGRYSEPLRNPHAFDELLGRVEERSRDALKLENARIRRIALSSWSAGFGAIYHIIKSRSRLDRIDSLLMMDSLHASFQPGSETLIAPLSVQPFVRYAERAKTGDKLFVLTHSAVETHDYPSTTQSADALLERVEVTRESVDPEDASPPPSTLEVAIKAFPKREKGWMTVNSEAHAGDFHVIGSSGDGKDAHIAHLAQMADTVMPYLVKRWSKKPPSP